MLCSIQWRRCLPAAYALTSGVFVGRALSIWTAIWWGDPEFPTATLLLAGVQWMVLAYVIRPAHLIDDTSAVAHEPEEIALAVEED